jgi:hypothetical protein
MRQILIIGSLAWAVIGVGIALSALPDVNTDARLLVAVLSVVLPLAAVAAAWCVRSARYLLAGALLVLSMATPTYMTWALNLLPLALAVAALRLSRVPHPTV